MGNRKCKNGHKRNAFSNCENGFFECYKPAIVKCRKIAENISQIYKIVNINTYFKGHGIFDLINI